jgi:hypothetical protein
MEALMIWSLIHSQLLIFRNGRICRSLQKAEPCVFGKQYLSLSLIPRAPLATEQKFNNNEIIQIHLWNPWEHCWELENIVGNPMRILNTSRKKIPTHSFLGQFIMETSVVPK